MAHPPKRLQPILWSTNVKLLDLERDKNYIIHQVLLYGTFKELRWLLQTYTQRTIIYVFTKHPIKMYPRRMYYFIKNFLLSLHDRRLDEERYVTAISGPVKPRATDRLS